MDLKGSTFSIKTHTVKLFYFRDFKKNFEQILVYLFILFKKGLPKQNCCVLEEKNTLLSGVFCYQYYHK